MPIVRALFIAFAILRWHFAHEPVIRGDNIL